MRKERPHPGAQLRLTDSGGLRLTAFATNTTRGQPPDLELRHRRRARCEDRIRNLKDTGLANLPLFGSSRTSCGAPSSAWPASSWPGPSCSPSPPARTANADGVGHEARRWEPKRTRLRLLSAAGRLTTSGRRRRLHLARTGKWTQLLLHAINVLRALPAPT